MKAELQKPSPTRIWSIAQAYELGISVEEVHELTKIDRWFLSKLQHIHRITQSLRSMNLMDLGANAVFQTGRLRRSCAIKTVFCTFRAAKP